MITKLFHSNPIIAQSIYTVFQESYAVEAEILNVIDFPPLKRPLGNFIDSDSTFYGFLVDDELAGVIEITAEETHISIESLVVKPSFFRQGIAQQLMQFAFKTHRVKKYIVETGLANEPAIKLYSKLGFVEVDQWDTDFGLRKIKFERTIKMDSIEGTKKWLSGIVIELSLCPFASKVFTENQILFLSIDFISIQSLIEAFENSIIKLMDLDSQFTTALLIITSGLESFENYLDVFYTLEDKLIYDTKDKDIQLASFHPNYQFDGTKISDVSNYTNRSPYPIIHLLRTDLVEQAIDSYPNVDAVPVENIKKMERLGLDKLMSLFGV